MKRKITLLLIAACSVLTMTSQIVLQEDFTAPFTPAAAGWGVLNLSSPIGSATWFQGNGAGTFPAFNGGPNDYYGCNFNSQGATPGGISNWLITPVVTIYNGGVLQFATKCALSTSAPDRMQVRMSSAGTNSAIPSGTASVGTFTTLLLDINPNLTTNSVGLSVNNGSVNGYPTSWTVYTIAITGVTGTVTGRFAFRYFVDDGGTNGANSDYIGVDAVRYNLPCGPTVQSYTTCAGVSTTLTAIGGAATTTYSWNTGATTSSAVVSPNTTTVYTLTPSAGTVSCGNAVTATITVGAQLSMSLTTSSSTICSGRSVVLTAISPAATYTWSTGANNSVITVTPNTTTTYSVAGQNGPGCFGGNSITVNVLASPSLSVSLTPACIGGSFTILASGANSYTYLASTSNPQTIASPTAAGAFFFTLSGTAANGCVSSGVVNFTAEPTPTVVAVASKTFICINQTVSINANGADTYSWSGTSSSTNTPFTYSSSTAGLKPFSVVGTSTTSGCSGTAAVNVNVSLCTGIEKVNGDGSHIFPNQFTNQITISDVNGQVQIVNALGLVVIDVQTGNT